MVNLLLARCGLLSRSIRTYSLLQHYRLGPIRLDSSVCWQFRYAPALHILKRVASGFIHCNWAKLVIMNDTLRSSQTRRYAAKDTTPV